MCEGVFIQGVWKGHCKNQHHQSVLPKSRSFAANTGTKAPVLPKSRSSTAISGKRKVVVLLGMNRCGYPLLSAPHSLFSIRTDLIRSENIPGAPTRKWGEWIWLTATSGLHRNSPQGLNFSTIRVFDQIRDPETPINVRTRLSYKGVILFSKIFYVFDVVYVKWNSISCEFSGLNYVTTL